MTDKKENILKAALHLFAEVGYASASTSKVAKMAGVSEGLIFRHFENKEGLLKAILALGKTETDQLFERVLSLNDPKKVIKGVLEIPFLMDESQYPFWKLLYSLKWQTESYDSSMTDAVRGALSRAFEELAYENPAAEAEIILLLLDGLATSMLLHKPENPNEILLRLLKKYDL